MLVIIPAREGSKALPGKNIKPLGGVPLIAHTIKAALASKHVTRVIVSTDSQEIYDISLKYGAHPSFLRPKHLATDDSKVVDTYLYTVDRLQNETNEHIEQIVVLQPTSPLRTSADIDNAIELFKQNKSDSVISYTEEHHPILWHKYVRSDLTLESIFPDLLENRQSLRKSYYPNGAVYIFKMDLLRKRKYSSENTHVYIMPRSRSIDIDTIEDFEYADFLFSRG
ncbi:cytidylyltransferase domain-containing protein [Bdellovibrio bacteriovorus]